MLLRLEVRNCLFLHVRCLLHVLEHSLLGHLHLILLALSFLQLANFFSRVIDYAAISARAILTLFGRNASCWPEGDVSLLI